MSKRNYVAKSFLTEIILVISFLLILYAALGSLKTAM